MAPKTIKLKEHVDMAAAKKVLASGVMSQHDYHNFANYLATAKDDWVEVVYTKMEYGRYQSQVKDQDKCVPHCTTLLREVRNHLFCRYAHDVDISNCQPTLMSQAFMRHGIATPHLTAYIQNRDIKKNCLRSSSVRRTKIGMR